MVTPTIPEMLKKLNELYDKEDEILNATMQIMLKETDKKIIFDKINPLKAQYQQLQEDKELLQTMIMHQSNKRAFPRRCYDGLNF